ncbi:hypothetical protein HDU93_007627 [Gonapodya sp. JEL0774]|nr:hypothetical protein HDU93_007627 [Gonapodya sp. JEL0774]
MISQLHQQKKTPTALDTPAGTCPKRSVPAGQVLQVIHPLLQEQLDRKEEKLRRKTEHKPPIESLDDRIYEVPVVIRGVKPPPHENVINHGNKEPPRDLQRLYVISHHAYEPGEHRHYPYQVPESSEPPGRVIHEESGKGVHDALHWTVESKIVDLRHQKYQEKHHKSVGQAYVNNDMVYNLEPNHTFGIIRPKDPPFTLAHNLPETENMSKKPAKPSATPDDIPAGRPSHQRDGALGRGRMRRKLL